MRRLILAVPACAMLATAASAAYSPVGVPVTTTLTSAQYGGAAFQPCPATACDEVVNAVLSSTLSVAIVATLSESATQSGTYVTVASQSIPAAILTSFNASISAPVPKGWWVKVTFTNTGLLSAATVTSIVWTRGN